VPQKGLGKCELPGGQVDGPTTDMSLASAQVEGQVPMTQHEFHLLRAAPQAVARFPLGELASRLGSDSNRVSDTIAAVIETLVPDLALLAGMTVITALLDWRLTLVVLGVSPLYVLAARLRNRSLRPAQQQARARAGELSAQAAGLLARIPAVHVFGRADSEVTAYHRASTAAAGAAVTAIDVGARFSPLTDALPGLGLAAALVAGTVEVSSGRLTIGGLLVFLAYLSSLTGPLQSLAQLSSTVTRGAVSRERINELLRLPLITPERRSTRHSGVLSVSQVIEQRGAPVEIMGVSYAHQPGHEVLRSASLRVAAGEFVCVTGPSGAGKSTLLSLLVRLAEPDSGLIRIGGSNIARLHRRQLRRLVTLVPQDPWLHSGSIADNIGYGNQTASESQIRAAAELAGVTSFTDALPCGMDTEVGEHGRQLSGGQQRRVAVARALAADTPVLLLDEPTTGLDVAAEEQLVGSLLNATIGKTVILVTHSERLAALANRVVLLDHGKLQEALPASRALGYSQIHWKLPQRETAS
jgi:ATP-binding cassette, subfamily B, bacterial